MSLLEGKKGPDGSFQERSGASGNGEKRETLGDWRRLLAAVKGTAEGLLVNHSAIVWNVYGGLTRLHTAVEKILQHGCKIFTPEGDPDYLTFMSGDSSTDPSLQEFLLVGDGISFAPSLCGSHINAENLHSLQRKDKASLWLYRSLEEHRMSSKLSSLLKNQNHLLLCYEPSAFLCQAPYAQAALVCLQAVEQNLPSLLANIDPILFIPNSRKESSKTHRRSASYPEWAVRPKLRVQSGSLDMKREEPSDEESEEAGVVDEGVGITVVITRPRSNTWEKCGQGSGDSQCGKRRNTWDPPGMPPDGPVCPPRPVSPSQLKIDYTTSFRPASPTPDGPTVSVLPTGFSSSPGLRRRQIDSSSTTLAEEEPRPKKKGHSHSKSDSGIVVTPLKPAEATSIPLSTSTPLFDAGLTDCSTQSASRQKSFMEGGGSCIVPGAVGFFPRPLEGQSLTSFLSSCEFGRGCGELDRENAHFSVSEALIAAMEQVKCRRMLRRVEEEEGEEDSDEEIRSLKQRIRIRRRQRRQETRRINTHHSQHRLLSDGRTDTTTTDQSVSPPTSSNSCTSDSLSTDDIDDFEVDNPSSLAALKDSGLSVSLASLYSEADLSKRSSMVDPHPSSHPPHPPHPPHPSHLVPDSPLQTSLTDSFVSAECVALSLLSKFSERQLPRASDLQWLVSEQEAPQQLLPLPNSWPVSPDEAEDQDMSQATQLRGNLQWAPPRPQIICHVHQTPNRKVLLTRQNHRCCGCGIKVDPAYIKSFRYCHYLGKYFCTGCHENQLAVLPGKVVEKWDCSKYPVSRFSAKLLESMHQDPLFNIKDLNEVLYRRVKALQVAWGLRLQLCYLKDYVLNCRFAASVIRNIKAEAPHLLSDDVHTYSIQDLLDLKSGELVVRLRNLLESGMQHVKTCQLCQARGFICELCRKEEVIFPFQWPRVSRCPKCCACHHSTCFRPGAKCPRCQRLSARRLSIGEDASNMHTH